MTQSKYAFIALLVLLCQTGFTMVGCGTSNQTTIETELGQANELESANQSESESEFESQFRKLSEAALLSEKNSDWDSAIKTWNTAIKLTTREYGEESWQTRNVKLAVMVAEKRRRFTDEDRAESAMIAEHQRATKQYLQTGEIVKAIIESEKTIEAAHKVWGAESHVTANFDEQHAQLLSASGNHQVAADYYLEAIRKREKALTKFHPDYERAVFELGMLYSQVGQTKFAIEQFRSVALVSEQLWGSSSLQVARARNEIAVVLHRVGDLERAAEAANEAATIRRTLLGVDSDQYAHSLLNLGVIRISEKNYDLAAEHLSQASTSVDSIGDSQQNLQLKADVYSNLGTVELLRGNFAESETAFQSLTKVSVVLFGEQHPVHAGSLFKLAVAIGNQKRFDEAEKIMLNSIAIQRKSLSNSHPDLIRSVNSYARLLEQMGRPEEAKTVLASVQRDEGPRKNIARQPASVLKK